MADASELKKIQETLDYFNRYYEFDSALKVLRENRQYLETYIRNKHYVEDKYDVYGKTRKSMLIAAIVAAVGALIVLIATGFRFAPLHIVIAAIVAIACFAGVFFVMKMLIKKNVDQKWAEQQKVNEDIAVQIQEVEKRCENLENQKNGYLDALDEKKLIVIPSKYIIEAQKIASYVKDGKAETAQQAVKMFEDEQSRLKERALAERKRREEEAAAAKALNIERDRQRAIREQREAELRKVAEEERQRANVTAASDSVSMREQSSEPADEQTLPGKGLSLAMGGGKRSERKPSPKLQEKFDSNVQSDPQDSGLSLSLGNRSGAPSNASAQENSAPIREHRTVESVMHGGEMSGFAGTGLSLASSNNKKKRPQRQIPKQAEEKPSKKYEPIRLVDEPDDAPEAVDEETLDLEARMQSLLTANKPVLKRHTSMTSEERDSLEARIETQLQQEQPKPNPEPEPEPIPEPEPVPEVQPEPEPIPEPEPVPEIQPELEPVPEPEPVPEVQPEPVPEIQPEPEPVPEPEPIPEVQPEPEPIPEPEPVPEVQPEPEPAPEPEKPKSPFSGLAMKKK